MNQSPHYYNHANRVFVDLLARRHPDSLSVLDVGCGAGALGEAVMQLTPAVFDGIEFAAGPAHQAREAGYRNVFELDLQSATFDEIRPGFDVITFGDVLEHLADPQATLVQLLPLLKPDGQILVSLPNIGFVACRMSHLLGKWEYRDYGIMDRTHLRFYTLETMRSMLHECGLSIDAEYGYVGLNNHPAVVREPARWAGSIWPSLFAIQIVFAARLRT